MVKTLKVKKEDGQRAREFLLQKGWLDKSRIIGRTELRYLILSLNEKADEGVLKKMYAGSRIEHKNMPMLPEISGNLKQMLKKVIPEKDIDKVVRSYDVIGNVAVLEIPKEMERYELQIAHALKRMNPFIKTVLRKAGKISAEFRIRPLKHISGEKITETIHKEAGVTLHLDFSKVYYSPRSSGERMRIARLVKPGEDILVMFSGIAVYPLIIGRVQQNCHIWAIEKNPDAVAYAERNIRANHMGHIITSILGDVKDKMPELGMNFDRIIMPFPEKAKEFLDLAFKYIKPHGVIHYYTFLKEKDIEKHIAEVQKIAEKQGKEIEVQNWFRAGSYAPKVWRFVFDILVE